MNYLIKNSKNRNKTFSLLKISVFLTSVLVSVFVANNSFQHDGYGLYFLVPLTFGFGFIICKDATNCIFKKLGLTVMFFVLALRYIVLPFIASLGDYTIYLGAIPSSKLINLGVILTLTEMVTIFVISTICAKKALYNSKSAMGKITRTRKAENQKQISENVCSRGLITQSQIKDNILIKPINSTIVYLGMILLAITLIVIIPASISDYHFVLSSDTKIVLVSFYMDGLVKSIITFARYIAVLLVINYSYKKYLKHFRFKYVIYAIIAVLINMTVTTQLSRFSILVPTIAFTYLLIKLFPKEKKKVIFITFGSLLGILVFITTIKFFGIGRGLSENANNITWWANTLQSYLAGPNNIAIAIQGNPIVESKYGFYRIALLFTDLFSNVAFVSNFITTNINSINIFNYSYYGNTLAADQIVPLVGTGYFYFGYIFAPLWTAINVIILFWLDEKAINSQYLDQKFLFNYVSVYFGFQH